MSSVVVLQARTNSSRLPGKVLLPVAGIPVAVLAAKRSANSGRQVIVATSLEKSDDGFVETLSQYGVSYFRGSLENTLSRVVGALDGFDDNMIVFRLTADNVFPDGAFLDELETEFICGKHEYLCCNGVDSGLPYGMSAEITRLGHLRQALNESSNAYDLEHVTPFVARKFGRHYFEKYKVLGLGHFRCTIDCLDDYLCIQRIFSGITDPITESAFSLIAKLRIDISQPATEKPARRLVMGTAQFGTPYGISNIKGMPSLTECQSLLKYAISNGVEYIDTARAYGISEENIGHSLRDGWAGRARIVTKLSPMTECPSNATNSTVNAFVDLSIYQSLLALNLKKLDTVLLHRASNLCDWQGAAWNRLLEHQKSGRVEFLGVSVQTPEELLIALEFDAVCHIQMPFNILDWRWDSVIPTIIDLKSRRKLTIHVRSTLLQGLLLSNNPILWQRAHVADHSSIRAWLSTCCVKLARRDIADLCINFVNSLPWVDGVVIGTETVAQLVENINIFDRMPLAKTDIESILETRPYISAETLNPTTWRIS